MAFVDIDKGEQVALATETGDDGTLTDKTACLTDDSSATSCVEIKSAVGIRFEINLPPDSIDPGLARKIRIGVNSIMAADTLRLAPYSDANSINNTNGITTPSIDCAGTPASCPGDVDIDLTTAFLDDAGDLGGKFAIRVFENGSGAKIKVGELDRDLTQLLFTVDGITRDKDEVVLTSARYIVQKRTATSPETWIEAASGISNATTGVYTEQLPKATYRVVSMKAGAPPIQAILAPLMIFTGVTDDVLALGKFHGLANDDQVEVYKAGTPALPVGLSEGTTYFVINLSGDTCKLSLTQGGAAVDITVAGEGILAKKPQTS